MINYDKLTMLKYSDGANLLNQFADSYVVVDLETTGINTNFCKIIEISALKVVENAVTETFSKLVNPCMSIPAVASRVNGITDDLVENAPIFSEIAREFCDFIDGFILLGHNAFTFDARVLVRELDECGITQEFEWIDSMQVAKRLVEGPYKLSNLCNLFGIINDDEHRALSDCKATHEVYQALKNLHVRTSYQSKIVEHEALKGVLGHELNGKTFAITGQPKQIHRKALATNIVRHGGNLSDSVTLKTNYLICCSQPGKIKMQKAMEYQTRTGIEIISEETYYKLLNLSKKEFLNLKQEFSYLDKIKFSNRASKNGLETRKKIVLISVDGDSNVTQRSQPSLLTQPPVPSQVNATNTSVSVSTNTARKKKRVSKVKYILLSLFLGMFGIQKFYAGKPKLGVLYLLFCWAVVPYILSIFEVILLLPKEADENGMIMI